MPLIWSTLQGWDKHSQRSVLQPLFMLIGIFTLLIHVASGKVTLQTLQLAALAAPVVLAASWPGYRAYKRISEPAFKKYCCSFCC